MSHICVCKYPLLIVDNRDGQEIEYIAMPIDVIKGGGLSIPDIDFEETEGPDGIIRDYISVKWRTVKQGDVVKKYDVAGHIVTAGCEFSETSKGEDGKFVCDEKSIYVVLHPADEWLDQHVLSVPKDIG